MLRFHSRVGRAGCPKILTKDLSNGNFVLSPEKRSSGNTEDATGALLEGYEVVGDSRLLTGQEQTDAGQLCDNGFADVSQSLDFSRGMHGNH